MIKKKVIALRGASAASALAATLTLALGAGTSVASDCCSCTTGSVKTLASPQLPCLFDHPATWEPVVGDDGALVSAIVGPASCGKSCPVAEPAFSVSFGAKPDSNAATMEDIWKQVMPSVGTARCGDATVTFYSPPGSDDTGLMGGVKFYVGVGGKKYGGAANFTCGQPGGWLALRKMFIDSFRDNPQSTFGSN
jgi:hypothetical protein